MLNRWGLLLYTKIFGQYVDTDTSNNVYYKTKNSIPEKRWVIYNGIYDSSKIPANWHSWLHFMRDTPPEKDTHMWIPNTTGTKFAHKQITSIEKIPQIALDCYSSWSPNK